METLIQTETSIAYHEVENHILYITIKDDAEIDVDDIKESISAREKYQQGKKMLVFVDARKLWRITKEARSYAAQNKITSMSTAMAVLTDSLATKILVNFFIKFDKPNAPTKMFHSEEEALSWLATFL